jgi:hypothetical protein
MSGRPGRRPPSAPLHRKQHPANWRRDRRTGTSFLSRTAASTRRG